MLLDTKKVEEFRERHSTHDLKVVIEMPKGAGNNILKEFDPVGWGYDDYFQLATSFLGFYAKGNLRKTKTQDKLHVSRYFTYLEDEELEWFAENRNEDTDEIGHKYSRLLDIKNKLEFRFHVLSSIALTALLPGAKTSGYYRRQREEDRYFMFDTQQVRQWLSERNRLPDESDSFTSQFSDVMTTFWFSYPQDLTGVDQRIKEKSLEHFPEFFDKEDSIFKECKYYI